ncbi:MAG TPA: hypothetical protein VKU01_18765 [Bryobacteraceae bacterium]|nr:hypothetical protein [Bryobacteraceae bacterium]
MNSERGSDDLSAQAIADAVARVLASEGFNNSKRLQRFLSYVSETALAGHPEQIKEYNVALAVFDRPSTFDTRMDTIVRVEARRLRQQLAVYYQGAGESDPVRIEIPKGGYVPVFHSHNGKGSPAPSAAKTARRAWLWEGAAGTGLLLICTMTLWLTGVFPRRHLQPGTWKLEGATLQVLTAQGKLCWKKTFAPFDTEVDEIVREKVLIDDIDGDGRKEVLFNFLPSNSTEGGSLMCFDDTGRLRWQHHLGRSTSFAGRDFEANYRGRFIRTVRISGKPYILTVANHYLWYPAQVALLDAGTGHLYQEYWHPGSIYECVIHDIDGDGQNEVLLGAVNNPGQGLGHSALAMLNLPFSNGRRGFVLPSDHFLPLTGGGERAYVLFPLPDAARVMGMLPVPVRLSVNSEHRILFETPIPENGGIVYYLDSRLHVLESRFSDNLPAVHEHLFQRHLLDHHFGEDEIASLGKVIHFAAAPDGNSDEIRRLWKY